METPNPSLLAKQIAMSPHGNICSVEAVDALCAGIGECIAPWYRELLCHTPLAGGRYRLPCQGDESYLLDLEWLGPNAIRDEAERLMPGCGIKHLGFVPVAADPTGGGDPFFVNFRVSVDPPLIQVFHETIPDRCLGLEKHMWRECFGRLSAALVAARPCR